MGEFGKYIKNKRIEKRYTLIAAAKLLGISFSYLSDIENGKKLPPNSLDDNHKELMQKIKKHLELSEEEYEELVKLADKELMDRGHLANEINQYMIENPIATVALRKATKKNLSEDAWKKIIEEMDKK